MMNYENILREHNLKATNQRVGILSIMEQKGHISIEDLYSKIKLDFPSISLATLYKNMHAMLKNELLTEIKVENSKTHFEIASNNHAHLYCEKCRELVDLDIEFKKLNNEILKDSGFLLNKTNLTFSGICIACQGV
ncbi:MAG: transcriptional repressor [Sulfurimonas sp.]|nr:transcriptional repressor [Sulfurimonas sp.]